MRLAFSFFERGGQEAGRLGAERGIRKQRRYRHNRFPVSRQKSSPQRNGLRLEGLALLAHVGSQIGPACGRIRFDADQPHRGTTTVAVAVVGLLAVGLRVCPKTSGGITKFSEHEAD